MPAGHYVLKMGYENAVTGRHIGQFSLPEETDDIGVELPQDFPPLGSIQPPVPLGLVVQDELSLVGYSLDTDRVTAGGSVWLTLYWQALTDVSRDYVIGMQLLDATGAEVAYLLGRPVRSSYSTDRWQAQQVVQDPWRLDLPSDLSPSEYTLQLAVFDAGTQSEVAKVVLGSLLLVEQDRSFDIPDMQNIVDAGLGDRVRLLGYDMFVEPITGGGRLQVTLHWQTQEEMESSYKVFVHLLNPDGEVVAQHDSVPGNGELPTTDWAIGEIVSDRHQLEFIGLPAGQYRLVAGMYEPTTGERLLTPHGDTAVLLETQVIN
jgi:hypothetical protein